LIRGAAILLALAAVCLFGFLACASAASGTGAWRAGSVVFLAGGKADTPARKKTEPSA
jgi:hypothetical protein